MLLSVLQEGSALESSDEQEVLESGEGFTNVNKFILAEQHAGGVLNTVIRGAAAYVAGGNILEHRDCAQEDLVVAKEGSLSHVTDVEVQKGVFDSDPVFEVEEQVLKVFATLLYNRASHEDLTV